MIIIRAKHVQILCKHPVYVCPRGVSNGPGGGSSLTKGLHGAPGTDKSYPEQLPKLKPASGEGVRLHYICKSRTAGVSSKHWEFVCWRRCKSSGACNSFSCSLLVLLSATSATPTIVSHFFRGFYGETLGRAPHTGPHQNYDDDVWCLGVVWITHLTTDVPVGDGGW